MRLALALALLAAPAVADPDHAGIAERALDEAILPGFATLAAETEALAAAARSRLRRRRPGRCPARSRRPTAAPSTPGSAVSHLRFGPIEEDNAGFAIAFWPDTRGATPRAIEAMVAAEDPVVDDPAAFRAGSVAARGLFALDYLLFDPAAPPVEAGGYRCRLLVAITADLAATAAQVLARWRDPFAGYLSDAGAPGNPLYLSPEESTRELYSALTEGLQATHDLRLGRPLGTPDRPQPRRAEAWRSGRSLRNVVVALAAMRAYAATVFGPEIGPEAAATLDAAFAAALAAAEGVGAPLDVAVATPRGRFRVEALQQAVGRVLAAVGRPGSARPSG